MATRVEWEKRVERLQKSGQDAEAFADREGIRPKSLVWWRWKLPRRRAARLGHGDVRDRALTGRRR